MISVHLLLIGMGGAFRWSCNDCPVLCVKVVHFDEQLVATFVRAC